MNRLINRINLAKKFSFPKHKTTNFATKITNFSAILKPQVKNFHTNQFRFPKLLPPTSTFFSSKLPNLSKKFSTKESDESELGNTYSNKYQQIIRMDSAPKSQSPPTITLAPLELLNYSFKIGLRENEIQSRLRKEIEKHPRAVMYLKFFKLFSKFTLLGCPHQKNHNSWLYF